MNRPTPFPVDATPFVAQAELDSPLGPLTALATDRGLAGLWFDAQAHHPGEFEVPVDAQHPHIAAARAWLAAYWGGRDRPRRSPLDPQGTDFQQAVWRALLRHRRWPHQHLWRDRRAAPATRRRRARRALRSAATR